MPARSAHILPKWNDSRERLLQAARFYLERGLVVTPNNASTSKGAYLPGWGTRRLTLSELTAELDRPGKGIGVVLGEPSGGLVDVDLDHAAAVLAADALLPPTGLVSGRTGRPRTHRFYRAPGAASAAFTASTTGMLVELRATGCQTALPPSPHPEGRYHWDSLGEPTALDARLLHTLTGQVAAAAFLIAQGWTPQHAAAFAGVPAVELISEWERQNEDCPPFRKWLAITPAPGARPCPEAPKSGSSEASPYTHAILAATNGVVGTARLLGLELHEGHQRCPLHDGQGARVLQVSGPLWRCHAGCGSGNAIHLAMRLLGVDYREARNVLASRLGIRWQGHVPRGGGGVKRRNRDQGTTREKTLDRAGTPYRAEPGARG